MKRATLIRENIFFRDPRSHNVNVTFHDNVSLRALDFHAPAVYIQNRRNQTRSNYHPSLLQSPFEELQYQDAGMVDDAEFDEDLWRACRPYALDPFVSDDLLDCIPLYDVQL